MVDKTIRLRVVVQRNGLPDNKFMFPVSLEDDPTIAKLLEQINSTYFPIESDQWGLEDYSVYRQAPDGSKFECLHFSTIQSIFRDDDQVIIRPLQTDDLRRRRISGRYQISSDGRHLVDGVPFGRPLLRVPVNRPPVYIPPRKKRRLIYGQDESAVQDDDDREDTPMLLLTNGHAHQDQHQGQTQEEEEEDGEDEEYGDDDFEADEQQSENMEVDDDPAEDDSEVEADEDLAEELQGLREENAALGEDDAEEQEPVDKPQPTQDLDLEALDKISALQSAFPSAPLDICEKVLVASDGELKKAYTTLSAGFPPQLSDTATLAQLGSGPAKPNPRRRRKTTANATTLTLAENNIQDSKDDENLRDDEEETERVSEFVRQFDHRGLPPGSITSGKGLSYMAFTSEATSATLVDSNGSKPSPEKTMEEEDDETSSSGTSSSSENGESERNDDDSDDSDGNDSSDEGSKDGVDFFGADSDSDSSDADDSESSDGNVQAESSSNAGMDIVESSDSSNDDSDNDSKSDSDSGPEEATTKGGSLNKSQARGEEHKGARLGKTTASEDSSDSSLDESSADDDSSDEESSEAESSSDDSSSDSDSDEDLPEKSSTPTVSKKTSPTPQIPSSTSISATQTAATTAVKTQPTLVPPGQGKESTKSRNARRRAAQKAKKQTQTQLEAETAQMTTQNSTDNPLSTSSAVDEILTDAQLLFEAKRKALLDALASGGIEVDSKGEMVYEDNSVTAKANSKRKRDDVEEPAVQGQTLEETSISEPGTAESDASQKRRRLDVGAGRRLLFGALGLRNPKGKDEADKVRARLMEGVRPLTNHRLEKEKSNAKQPDTSVAEPSEEEDPEAWRDLITYRAVECCQEGVELSEPPFPFVQRWDPQQQGSWFHKNSDNRGGRGKRAERNQAHFYQEDPSSSRKKRKHDESFEWGGEGYDETFNGIEDEPRGGDDIELNYDDVVEPDQEMNDTAGEASQFTDLDDLPSLPADLSSLPILRPGEVKPGMVITWQKWSCSAATSWQPRLSGVTGVVVRIDDDATGLEVCLAKRDRGLDGIQKRYDPITGKRVYEKFEAPDLEEEDDDDAGEEDEGYRTLSFADMVEPRILQQPFSLVEDDKPAETEATSPKPPAESDIPKVPENSNEEVPTQPEVESHVTEPSLPVVGDQEDVDIDASVVSPAPPTEPAKEDEGRNASNSTDHQPGQGGQDLEDLSMSDMSQISSPSRQLHETTSQAINSTPVDPSAIASSGYKGDVDTEAIDTTAPVLLTSDPVDSRDQSSAPAFSADDDEVITGTPKVKYAKMTAPSSVSSVRSGRQLDYTMDEDEDDPGSLRVTEADDEVHGVSTILGTNDDSHEMEGEEDITTPTPSPTKLFSSDQVTPLKATEQSSRAPSTPGSLASINTIFCTARTSRQTQSPSKSQSQSQVEKKPPRDPIVGIKTTKDLEYEEAMRKLDAQSADDHQDEEEEQEESSNIPDSFRPIINNDGDSQLSVDIKDEQLSLPKLRRQPTSTQIKISPPPPKRPTRKPLQDRKRESSSQFSLPPGTQVIELLSSSDAEQEPEPQFTEDYADEEVDETYSPKSKSSSLPKGPGWIKKTTLDRTRNARSLTAPLGSGSRQFGGRQVAVGKGLSASQNQSQSQGHGRWSGTSQSNSPPSSSLPVDLGRKGSGANGKGRRKTSARF